MTNNLAQDTATGAPPRRSLFKKPAWARPQTAVDPVDFFSRSKEVYTEIIAEEDRERQKRIEKRVKADQKGCGPNAKRRRFNVEDEDSSSAAEDDDDDSGDDIPKRGKAKPIPLSDSDDENYRPPPPPLDDDDVDDRGFAKSLSRQDQNIVSARRTKHADVKKFPPEPILLSDDEESGPVTSDNAQPPKHTEPTLGGEHITHTSDVEEEFPELARKARERVRLNRIEAELRSPKPTARAVGNYNHPNPPQPQPTPSPPDPIVQIFISSRIANTQPLIVNRRTGQRLKDVRVTWCDRQGFNAEEKASVFLTWKGKRVFDVTTCKSLGISADAEGNVAWRGHEDGLGGDNRVHMEAMTEEIFLEIKNRTAGSGYSGIGNTEQGAEKEPEVEEKPKVEPSVKLTLKSQGYDDFKLIVKPSTTIAKMIQAFRTARHLTRDKQVFLQFDGDRLDPGVTVADTELGDMDHVDVYVR
ncbi:MAG: hypothetical protein M1840_006496 [Geoglossum simile]|nr:MAG: hypothetical protein M1840_006496 [Geoglossum simile]